MHYNWILEIYSSDKCYLLIMFIFALTISVIQGYIHKLSPVIKRAKNSTAFTSFFYKKVESKWFPWQEFKWQMLVFVGFHPILWCMTLKSLRDICVIFFFTGIRDRSGDFIIRPEGENLLKVDLKNIINPSTPSSD